MLFSPLSFLASSQAGAQDSAGPFPGHTPGNSCCPARVKGRHPRGKPLRGQPEPCQGSQPGDWPRADPMGAGPWRNHRRGGPALPIHREAFRHRTAFPHPWALRGRADTPAAGTMGKAERRGKSGRCGHQHALHPQEGHQTGRSHICLYCEQQVGHRQRQ